MNWIFPCRTQQHNKLFSYSSFQNARAIALLLLLFLTLLLVLAKPVISHAQLSFIQDIILADSEEPFADRIYYYDMAVDSQGKAHVLYALPQQDRIHSKIIYAVETNEGWQQRTISTQGKYIPTGIQIAVASNDTISIMYITASNDYDASLVYRTITPTGILSDEIIVAAGGWRSRLQLTPQDTPVIIREWSTGLMLYTWNSDSFVEHTIQLPISTQVRLGDFKMDTTSGCHILFGDFAHGDSHNLWYAYAPTPQTGTWAAQIIDNSGHLYEMEFWVDLTIDSLNNPIAASYYYNDGNIPTWGVFYKRQANGSWTSTISTRKQENCRAGMGPGLAVDTYGYHGVWDNSPPNPYEAESPRGTIFYRYSPDGNNWKVHQMLAPYSAEGRCVVRIKNNQLNVLVLGDYTDTKLHFLRYQLPADKVFDLYPDRMMYHRGEPITFNLFMRGSFNADLYSVCIGRQSGRIFQLASNLQWHEIPSLQNLGPVVSNYFVDTFNNELITVIPSAPPASVRDIFDCYSVAAEPGSNVLDQANWLTPLYGKYIYSNWQ